ncbi:MAG: ribokinase [Gaiellaceae bacterium]
MPPELTVVGSFNVDLVARCERLPQPGETVTDASFERHLGGKGANQAVAAARLGAQVRFVGAVGADAPELAQPNLEVDLDVVEAPTGIALITVDAAGETVIVVAPGANRLRTPPAELAGPVLCQLEIPVDTVADAAARAERFFLNAAPAAPLPAEVVRRAELVVVNRHELDALSETPRLTALTLGAEGAVLLEDGEEVVRARPPLVTAVDGTGAGDAFTACLVVSLLEERDREEALRRACAAGALAASRRGAQPSLPTAAELDAILAR